MAHQPACEQHGEAPGGVIFASGLEGSLPAQAGGMARRVPVRLARPATVWVVASVLSALWGLVVDAAVRPASSTLRPGVYLTAGVLVLNFSGVVLGACAFAFHAVKRRVGMRLAAGWGPWARAMLHGALLSGWCQGAVVATFGGRAVSATWEGQTAPWVLVGLVAGGVTLLSRWMQAVLPRGWWKRRGCLVGAGVLLAAAQGLIFWETHWCEGLYEELHALAARTAWALGALGVGLLVTRLQRSLRDAAPGLVLGASASLLAALPLAFSPDIQEATWEALGPAWERPLVVGRAARLAHGVLSGWSLDASVAPAQAILEKAGLDQVDADPKWDTPPQAAAALPGHPVVQNVVVFFVDALRFDTAHNAQVMPRAAAFLAGATSFERAYSTGSNTTDGLGGMVRGRYGYLGSAYPNLLRDAERMGVVTQLSAGATPVAALGQMVPDFRFANAHLMEDHEQGVARAGWGLGANVQTSAGLAGAAARWLVARPAESRSLSWVYNFDLHNWLNQPDSSMAAVASRAGLPTTGDGWKYNATAWQVDQAFGALLDQLDASPRAQDTAVLFVSDHGEGLGYRGLNLHTTQLWEVLVHVPVGIRIPGRAGRQVEGNVSLVDVAPTVLRLFDPAEDVTRFHGEDLLANPAAGAPARRFPILMVASTTQGYVRMGILEAGRKLVLSLDSPVLELRDMRDAHPDETDTHQAEPAAARGLLAKLVASPVFPPPPPR